MMPLIVPAETEPPNTGAVVTIGKERPTFEVVYEGRPLFSGRFKVDGRPQAFRAVRLVEASDGGERGEVTQHIALVGPPGSVLSLAGTITGSAQAFPAETYSAAQDRFKVIRNSVGLSSNLRNNAIYDRKRDWMLEGPGDGQTNIRPGASDESATSFSWTSSGPRIELTFRPRFYQKHKNIQFFHPWEYDVWKGSVTGWCSWWAYFADIHERDVQSVSRIFATKLRDFGYRYIQIDDGYQSGAGGLPKDWLQTNERFPSGLSHLAAVITGEGLAPALWLNVHFKDAAFVKAHPDWFIQDRNGHPIKGPWIDYGLDGSNQAAVDAVVRPTYRELRRMGWKYVKVDALRHLLYDDSYPSQAFFTSKGTTPEDAFRYYLKAIRQEVGPDTYMLACWGVLPEVVGIADGCRLGGDGFGPSTLQQYSSWNNVVWRNDPDHCDIKPQDRATGKYTDGEERIRPVLVSMAGAQLLLSDKPDVYEDDANLEGAKRSSPILFTLPGQLYDYDPVKTDHLKQGLRNEHGGANSGPIDADQQGEVCPWWMLDISRPFETWTVLTRMNWEKKPLDREHVRFRDLGLLSATYSVFEFWSKRYLGDFTDGFDAAELAPKDVATYALRKTLRRPQILSTSRHISQGAVDLERVIWKDRTLSGVSQVVRGDPYSLFVRTPAAYAVKSASFGDIPAGIVRSAGMTELKFTPNRTAEVHWTIRF